MDDIKPEPIHGIMEIDAYEAGKSSVDENIPKPEKIVKLSSNETPLGTSPAAQEAYVKTAEALYEYPNPSTQELRESIAKIYRVKAEKIVCGNGSDELLTLLAQAYLTNGDEAIYSQYGFLMYRINILACGATPIVAPENNITADVDAILERITEKTKIVFLANPNNPTGTYLSDTEIRRLHSKMAKNILLVIDAAYAEYMKQNDYSAGEKLVEEAENVVMTRTFSKIYGLASLRIGWVYAPQDIVDVLNRIRGPFNVNAAALAAANAAVQDQNHVKNAIEHNEQWRQWLKKELNQSGLNVQTSFGNFMLIQFNDTNTKNAQNANEYLMKKGYILRDLKSYGFDNALRMTIGTQKDNENVVQHLKEFLNE